MEHNYNMLTTKGSGAKVSKEPTAALEADLRFISENQRLEGFSGDITDAVRQHRPDFQELQAVSKKFGAQMPQSVPPPKN